MNIVKTSAVALTALFAVTGSAFAFNEGSVNQTDIAQVTSKVAQIEDSATRAQAQNLVDQAQGYAQDRNPAHAAATLERALDLVERAQVAERAD
jgi:hypothetical protein